MQSVKRTAESLSAKGSYVYSVVRFTDSKETTASPSAEALGYFRSVRFADETKILLRHSRVLHSFVLLMVFAVSTKAFRA